MPPSDTSTRHRGHAMSDTHRTEREIGETDASARRHSGTRWTRRGWISAAGAAVTGAVLAGDGPALAQAAAGGQAPAAQKPPLPLAEFEPKSMLHVAETRVAQARFPVVDFHTHVSPRRSTKPAVPPADIVKTMDVVNLRTMINLTGGSGDGLASTIASFARAFRGRFL